MYTHVQVRNYRSIADSGLLPLGPITVIIGRNNTGKSALLRAIYAIQDTTTLRPDDVRIGETAMSVGLGFDTPPDRLVDRGRAFPGAITLQYQGNDRDVRLVLEIPKSEEVPAGQTTSRPRISSQDPDNLFIPVFSGRRQSYYREQANASNTFSITPQDSFLVSRVMPLASGQFPEALAFRRHCKNILGVNFDVYPADQSQQIGSQVSWRSAIPLEAMGAGLSGALSLVLGLSTASGKLFLIEEPEDDLHPKALKDLLDAIVESSQRNQFIISTHSSIVLTRLGALASTQIIHVESDGQLLPTSSYLPVTDPADRMAVLQDLGYSLADLGLGQGWLIFEESSAEALVHQYLAKWFAPKLLSLRTVAARGNSRVEPLFEDYREMLLYAHLEVVYRFRAWVVVDGDDKGIELIRKLRGDFKTWPENHFRAWSKAEFESYYPAEFADRVKDVLALKHGKEKQEAKKALLLDVIAWINEDEDEAKEAFAQSAAEVVEVLQDIEAEVARSEPYLLVMPDEAE